MSVPTTPTAIQHVVLIVRLRFSSGNVICRAVT